jgi:hypothetical protein
LGCWLARVPLVAFKVLEFDAQRIIFGVGQHVDVLVAQPELAVGIAEAALVVVPVAIEVLAVLAIIVSPLDDLILMGRSAGSSGEKTRKKHNTEISINFQLSDDFDWIF